MMSKLEITGEKGELSEEEDDDDDDEVEDGEVPKEETKEEPKKVETKEDFHCEEACRKEVLHNNDSDSE